MVILNAWINGIDGDEKSSEIISEIESNDGILSNKMGMNGEVSYQFYICRNHYGPGFEFFLDKIRDLAVIESNEMHGLIYLFNDEDPDFPDEWQVWTISHGKLEKKRDNFLSPLSEKVFDFSDD